MGQYSKQAEVFQVTMTTQYRNYKIEKTENPDCIVVSLGGKIIVSISNIEYGKEATLQLGKDYIDMLYRCTTPPSNYIEQLKCNLGNRTNKKKK